MVPIPFPSIEESVDYLSPRLLFFGVGGQWWKSSCWCNLEELAAWKYHHFFVRSYWLYVIERVQKLTTVWKNFEYQYQRRVNVVQAKYLIKRHSFIDTGPPEWWGSSLIHSSHKLRIDRGYWGQSSLVIYPKVNLKQRLQNLQHLLRK